MPNSKTTLVEVIKRSSGRPTIDLWACAIKCYVGQLVEERVSRLTTAAAMNGADVDDHAASEIAIGSKLGIDATRKSRSEGFKRPWPRSSRSMRG